MISRRLAATFAAIPLIAGLTIAAPSDAQAQWRRGGFYHGGFYRGPGPVGAVVGGALLGLGVGAALAAPYYYRPPVVYAPPAYYPPYAYAPAPYYYYPRY